MKYTEFKQNMGKYLRP